MITSCRNQQPIKSEQMTCWFLKFLLTLPSKIAQLHQWQNDERIWGKFYPHLVPSITWITIRNTHSSKNPKYTLGKGEGLLILSALKEHFSEMIYLGNAFFRTINGHWRDLQFVLDFLSSCKHVCVLDMIQFGFLIHKLIGEQLVISDVLYHIGQ